MHELITTTAIVVTLLVLFEAYVLFDRVRIVRFIGKVRKRLKRLPETANVAEQQVALACLDEATVHVKNTSWLSPTSLSPYLLTRNAERIRAGLND